MVKCASCQLSTREHYHRPPGICQACHRATPSQDQLCSNCSEALHICQYCRQACMKKETYLLVSLLGLLLIGGLWVAAPIGILYYAGTNWSKNLSHLIIATILTEIAIGYAFGVTCAISSIRNWFHRMNEVGWLMLPITFGLINLMFTLIYFVHYQPSHDLPKLVSFTQLDSNWESFLPQPDYYDNPYNANVSVIYCPTSVTFKARVRGIPTICPQPTGPVFDQLSYDPYTDADNYNPFATSYDSATSIVTGYFNITRPIYLIFHCLEFGCGNGDSIGCDDLFIHLPDFPQNNRACGVLIPSGVSSFGPPSTVLTTALFICIVSTIANILMF